MTAQKKEGRPGCNRSASNTHVLENANCTAPDRSEQADYQRDDIAHPDLDPATLLSIYEQVRGSMTIDGPQFGSHAWSRLPDGDPAKVAATVRAAMAWWTAAVYGSGVPADVLDSVVTERLTEASKAVHAADPKVFSRHASDRAQRRLQGRDRSVYEPRSDAAA